MIGMFSTASIDNINVEIKSSLASTSLHGTAAPINQHHQDGSLGISREVFPLDDSGISYKNRPTGTRMLFHFIYQTISLSLS